jgi:AcrR family transcriptional regulator
MSGLRESKREALRRTVQRIAISMCKAHGFENVTVDEVAKAANVSSRTVFRHFSSKEEMLLWDDTDELVEAIRALPVGTQPVEAMRLLLVTLIPERFEQDRDLLVDRLAVLSSNPQLWNQMDQQHRMLADQLAPEFARLAGVPADDFSLLVFMRAFASMFDVVMHEWQKSGGTEHLPDIATRGLDLLASGLPVGPGPVEK